MFLKMKFCDEKDIGKVLTLQNDVAYQITDETQYLGLTKEAYMKHVENQDFMVGIYDKDNLIAFGVAAKSELGKSDLRQYIYMYYVENKETVLEVKQNMVHPEYRHKGLQRKLLKEFESIAHQINGSYLVTAVHPDNTSAIANLSKEKYLYNGGIILNGKYRRSVYVKKIKKDEKEI